MTQKSERRVIAGDWKRVYLDLPSWEIVAPSEGIYDEPTVYYKANLRWAKLIEGFVQHLTEITAWAEAEDENFHGIQQIITFLERIDVPFVFPEESGCNNFLPSAAFVSYYPQNPYNQPDFVPDDYLVPPFFVNDELEYPEIMGYKATDVFIAPASINIDPIDLITLNLPRIEITVKGGGQLEIDFLSVQAGSAAILKIGSMPNIIDIITGGIIEEGVRIIDLNNDSLSIPPESDIVISEEVNIEAEPDELTTVFIVFMPVIDDSLIPLALGGGIRQIGLCAFESMAGSTGVEDIRFNQETCFLEKRINGEWQAVEGWEYLAECLGVADMATKTEITEAIVDAWEIGASRFLSGDTENVKSAIVINTDFTKEYKSETVPDDPDTEIDEERSSGMGAAISVLKGVEKFLDRVDTYYGATNGTPVTPQADAIIGLSLLFQCDESLLNLGVDAYYTYRATNPRILYDNTVTHQLYMYCKGANKLAWDNLLIELSGYVSAKIIVVAGLTNALLPAFWTKYYEDGLDVPSTIYQDASCVPSPSEIFYQTTLGVAAISQTSWKSQHRLLVTAEGYATDSLGNIRDFWWYDAVGATLPAQRFSGTGSTNIQLGTGIAGPTTNQCPYNAAHRYQFTIDTPVSSGDMRPNVPTNGMTAPITWSNGIGFKITVEDLGEYAV